MFRLADDAIRNLTNNKRLVKFARACRIASVLKRCEYRLRGPSDALVRHTIAGVEVVLAAPDATEFRSVEECYGDETDFIEALANKLRKGGVYYDVGSNLGKFLILISKIVGERGEAIGFEPHPANYVRLARNIALNGLKNARAYQVALADQDGQAEIFGARGLGTIVPRAAAWHGSKECGKTAVAHGDEFRRREGLPLPRAVKIHAEGAEYAVLRGLAKTLSDSACQLLCCVVHPPLIPAGVSPEMILSFVKSLGFDVLSSRPLGDEVYLVAEKKEGQ